MKDVQSTARTIPKTIPKFHTTDDSEGPSGGVHPPLVRQYRTDTDLELESDSTPESKIISPTQGPDGDNMGPRVVGCGDRKRSKLMTTTSLKGWRPGQEASKTDGTPKTTTVPTGALVDTTCYIFS